MKLLELSRGQIKIELENDEIIVVNGETMNPKLKGHSEYIIYENSLKKLTLNNNTLINENLKDRIFKFLEDELEKRKLRMIIE